MLSNKIHDDSQMIIKSDSKGALDGEASKY